LLLGGRPQRHVHRCLPHRVRGRVASAGHPGNALIPLLTLLASEYGTLGRSIPRPLGSISQARILSPNTYSAIASACYLESSSAFNSVLTGWPTHAMNWQPNHFPSLYSPNALIQMHCDLFPAIQNFHFRSRGANVMRLNAFLLTLDLWTRKGCYVGALVLVAHDGSSSEPRNTKGVALRHASASSQVREISPMLSADWMWVLHLW
jgi:hypothetical protein